MNKKILIGVAVVIAFVLTITGAYFFTTNKPVKKTAINIQKRNPKPYANVPGVATVGKIISKGLMQGDRRFMDIPNLVNTAADVIVIGKVDKIIKTDFDQSVKNPGLNPAYTDYAFTVDKVLMGSVEPTITVRAGFVVVTETTMTYQFPMENEEFAPYLYPGQQVLLFLGWAGQPPLTEEVKSAPRSPNTYEIIGSSQAVYHIDGGIASSGFYYKRELPPGLVEQYPFLRRDKQMTLDELISRIKGYIASGDTGYGPINRPSWDTGFGRVPPPPYLTPTGSSTSTSSSTSRGS